MSEEKKPGWLAYRSAPYAWERALLWVVILVCVGIDAGASLLAWTGAP